MIIVQERVLSKEFASIFSNRNPLSKYLTLSFPAVKRSSLTQNGFVLWAKNVCLLTNKYVLLVFGRWFRKGTKKEQKLGKTFLLTSFKFKMDLKKDRNKIEMKKRKKTTLHLLCILLMLGSLAFFHFCLVPVLFSGLSLTEMKFYKNFFPTVH